LFLVFNSNKSILLNSQGLHDIKAKLSKSVKYYEILNTLEDPELNEFERYVYLVARTYQKMKNLKSCLICRYGARVDWYNQDSGVCVFCKFLKKAPKSNDASDCKYFRAEPNNINTIIKEWNEKIL
jgi:hypothetical protein